MLIRSLPRTAPRASTTPSFSCTRKATPFIRTYLSTARPSSTIFQASQQPAQVSSTQQSRSAHAISNPTLAGIEKRWEGMPPQEQAELWMQLRERMKADWNELTLQEKKASWWIAFGPHGPRAEAPPGEWARVFLYTGIGLAVSAAIFLVIHSLARPPPKTMTKEWQEATNDYLKKERSNPLYGLSSEGYTGKGHVQSKSAKAQGIKIEEDD